MLPFRLLHTTFDQSHPFGHGGILIETDFISQYFGHYSLLDFITIRLCNVYPLNFQDLNLKARIILLNLINVKGAFYKKLEKSIESDAPFLRCTEK